MILDLSSFRQPRRRSVSARLACIVVSASLALPVPARQHADEPSGTDHPIELTSVVFETFEGDTVSAERGVLHVPENRSSGSERTIALQFVRFQSTNPSPGPPIVYLAGGPGGSGIAAARSRRFALFMALREVADVIALDQRGTGLSEPDLSCPESRYQYPLDEPLDRARWLDMARRAASICLDSLEDRGVDPHGYTTAESAADVDALGRSLGEEKLTLLGISYGTHLALATLRMFPERIDRAILAGVEGPDHTFMLPSDQERHLEFLAAAASKQAVSLHVTDLPVLVDSVLARLTRAPVTVRLPDRDDSPTRTVVVGPYDVRFRTAMAMNRRNWDIPRIFADMDAGDFSFVAGFMADFRRFQGVGGLNLLMECSSGASANRLEKIRAERKITRLGDARNFPYPDICDVLKERYPGYGLPDSFREPIQSNVPVLFISGTHDGVTPFSNAREVSRGFPNGRHFIIQGAEHSDDLLISTPLIGEAILDFLRDEPLTQRVVSVPFEFSLPDDR